MLGTILGAEDGLGRDHRYGQPAIAGGGGQDPRPSRHKRGPAPPQPQHKAAAEKNAYVARGKGNFQYAAAFFLLADNPRDALRTLHSGQAELTTPGDLSTRRCGISVG